MPGKHVHFGGAPYGSFSTPSPSFSVSTLPSTPGLITPPPLGFSSPYHTTPLPGIAACLHPILAAGNTAPKITFDLTFPPEMMQPVVPAGILDQPATKPEVPFLDITCQRLPWRITVVPRSQKLDYVTVGDVFAALYRALRINVTPKEYELVPSESLKAAISQAYRIRYKRLIDPAAYDAEKAKGMKRVDFLGSKTRFMGLVPKKGGAEGWILIVS